jgi:hypothetical protein
VLLAFGCTIASGKFIGTAAVLFLLDVFLHKNSYDFKKCCKHTLFLNTIKTILLFVGMYAIASLLVNSKLGIKMAGHYLERFSPFFLIMFLSYKREKIFSKVLIGVAGGAIVVFSSVLLTVFTNNQYRPHSIIGKPNGLGGWAILILPFLVALFFYYKNNLKLRMLACVGSLAACFCLVLSLSRGAMFGAIVMGVAALAYKFRPSCKIFLVAVASALLLSCGLYKTFTVSHRIYDGERILIQKSGIAMFKDNLLLGVGTGNFNAVYRDKYISPYAKEPELETPHNFILDFLDNSGLVGTSGLLVLLGSLIYSFYRYIFANKSFDWWVIAMSLAFLGAVMHGMVDIIILNRFHMMLASFFWGVTCYHILYSKETVNLEKCKINKEQI